MTIRQVIASALAALACIVPPHAARAEAPERWYDSSRVESGGQVYAANCAVCHGALGEATPDWRRPRARRIVPAAAAERYRAHVAPPVRNPRAPRSSSALRAARARCRRSRASSPTRRSSTSSPGSRACGRTTSTRSGGRSSSARCSNRNRFAYGETTPRAPRGRGSSLRGSARRRRQRLRDPPPTLPPCETGALPPGRGAAASYRGRTERARPRPDSGARRRAFRLAVEPRTRLGYPRAA